MEEVEVLGQGPPAVHAIRRVQAPRDISTTFRCFRVLPAEGVDKAGQSLI